MLYLALPTGKFSYFLSFSRLAPIQIQLGVGHPLTSASPNIDYSVVSKYMYFDLFEEENAIVKAERETVIFTSQRCAMEAYLCEDHAMHGYSQYLEALEEGHLKQEQAMKEWEEKRRTYAQTIDSDDVEKSEGVPLSLTPLPYDPTRSLFKECEISTECFTRDTSITPLYYSEQVVLFDSLAHFNGPLEMYYAENSGALELIEVARYQGLYLSAMQSLGLGESEGLSQDGEVDWSVVDHADTSLSRMDSSMKRLKLSTILSPTHSRYGFNCQDLDGMFREMKIYPNISSSDLPGCPTLSAEGETFGHTHKKTKVPQNKPKKAHIYHCVQYMKKMHPIMDDIFLRILHEDPQAKFLVVENFSAVYRRMIRRSAELSALYGWTWSVSSSDGSNHQQIQRLTSEELSKHFVQVPRVTHLSYLVLLSISSVFLNAVPYGSGMTSSEALSIGVPVITLARESSVLQFALGQLRALSDDGDNSAEEGHIDIARTLTATSREEYAKLAVSIAKGHVTVYKEGVKRVMDPTQQAFVSSSFELRKSILSRLDNLFSRDVLEKASREWESFFLRVSNV